MATIRKHRGKWQAIVRLKGQGSTSKTFHIRRDSERWAREQEQKLDNGTSFRPPHNTSLMYHIQCCLLKNSPFK